MSTPEPPFQPPRRRRSTSEEPIEVRRYLDAIRRSRYLILAIVVVLTSTVFLVSLGLPERYEATASIVKRTTTGPYESVNVDSLTRELSTIDRLLKTSDVLDDAGKKVGLSGKELEDVVDSSVDPDANLIFVTARRGDPDAAAKTANAVANTFVAKQEAITRSQYAQARTLLQAELDRIEKDPGASAQEDALRERLSEIGVATAAAGTDLSLAQAAEPPEDASSPRPFRNGILAIVLGLFIGVVVALGRDQLVPRVTSGRELGRLLDLPVLASIPYVGRRFRRHSPQLSGIEYDTYQALGSSLRFVLPPDSSAHMVIRPSALHAEGKSTVTARLGRALAQAGHDTLLISADLRWPTLHGLVNAPVSPGLTDLLAEYDEHTEGFRRLEDRLERVHRARGGPAARHARHPAQRHQGRRPGAPALGLRARRACSTSSASPDTATSSSTPRRCSGSPTRRPSRGACATCSTSPGWTG